MGKCKGIIVDCLSKWNCVDDLGLCYSVVSPKPDIKPNPNPKPENKKPEPKPSNVCKNAYGSEISNSGLLVIAKNSNGLEQFKKFLLKYYSQLVIDELGSTDKLNSLTTNDCSLIKLYHSGDPDLKSWKVGGTIYTTWTEYVGGYLNSDSKTKEEFDKWRKNTGSGNQSTDDGDNINYSSNDWQTLIDNGQISNKGKLISWDGVNVMLFKYDKDENRVDIKDDIKADGKIDTQKIISNINDNKNIYKYFKYPFVNEDEETKDKHPLKSKRYNLIVKKDANNVNYLDTDTTYEIVKIKKAKSKIDEMSFKKFILEKIREKNKTETILVEAPNFPQPTGTPNDDSDRDEVEGSESGSQISSSTQKPGDDIFGLNSIENKEARKIKYEEITPMLQGYITEGSKSDYFAEWNKVGKELGSSIKLKIPEIEGTNSKYSGQEINDNNEILVGEPAETNQYKKRYFYDLFDLKGDTSINTATIYMPQLQTTNQKIVIGKCDVKKCRTDLIEYLRVGFQNSYVPANEQERYDKMINICNCNAAGCFEGFKSRGKLAGAGFENKGYNREKLNVDQSATDKNVFSVDSGTNTVPKENLPRYNQTFNRNLTWNEIASYIRGDEFKVKGGRPGSFDSDLRIPNFGKPEGWCTVNLNLASVPETQKESFDKRIDKKLLETIRNKNKKESIVENILRNILKDKL
jgi:hypothetical protein